LPGEPADTISCHCDGSQAARWKGGLVRGAWAAATGPQRRGISHEARGDRPWNMPYSDSYAPWRCKAAPVHHMRPAHPPPNPRHRVRRARGRRRLEWTRAAVSSCMAAPRPSAPAAIPSSPVIWTIGTPGPSRLEIAPKSRRRDLRRAWPAASTDGRYLPPPRPSATSRDSTVAYRLERKGAIGEVLNKSLVNEINTESCLSQ